jgi:hypothetical protein
MMDENMFNKIREMERDLAFYEHAVSALSSSLNKGSMQTLVMNGSCRAVQIVKDLNDQIRKVVGRK